MSGKLSEGKFTSSTGKGSAGKVISTSASALGAWDLVECFSLSTCSGWNSLAVGLRFDPSSFTAKFKGGLVFVLGMSCTIVNDG